MENSQYEIDSSSALLEIKRAQRVLDETQNRLKYFKKQKLSQNKFQSISSYNTPIYPDIKQYLSYLINDQDKIVGRQNCQSMEGSYKDNKNSGQRNNNDEIAIDDKPDSNEAHIHKRNNNIDQINNKYNKIINFDIRKHTQQQLQKSQMIQVQKMEQFYKQNCMILDKKIQQIQLNKNKIKNDKILLIRNNQQLQLKIQQLRNKKLVNNSKDHPNSTILDKLNRQIEKLKKQLQKIQLDNVQIMRRKQDYQINIRVCIKNSQEIIQKQLEKCGKNKGACLHKLSYH